MISADQFHHCDVRMRQAKQNPERQFGGLALNICGDFLQLPPVDKDNSRRSLAMPYEEESPFLGQRKQGDDDEEAAVEVDGPEWKKSKSCRQLARIKNLEIHQKGGVSRYQRACTRRSWQAAGGDEVGQNLR